MMSFKLDTNQLKFMLIAFLLLAGVGCSGTNEQKKTTSIAHEGSPAIDWSGNWDTYWQEGSARLVLEQTGKKMSGSYRLLDGSVSGQVEGRKLIGEWSRGSKSGEFVFILSEDGDNFMGRYGSGDWWTGARVENLSNAYARIRRGSPREVMRSFLVASNNADLGDMESMGAALTTLTLTGADNLDEVSQVEQATLFRRVVNLFTFHLINLPKESEVSRVTYSLDEAGTDRTLELVFRRTASEWSIVVPPIDTLQAKLDQWSESADEQLERIYNLGDLYSPRATFKTFLLGMYENAGDSTVAWSALNTSQLSGSARAHEVPLLATYLRQVLNRISYVLWQEIPNIPERRDPYVHFRHPAGNVVVAPVQTADSSIVWKFTPETLESIRGLYIALENIPRVAGPDQVENLPFYFQVRNAIRGHAPSLLQPFGQLERWQWYGLAAMVLAGFLVAGLGAVLVRGTARRQSSEHSDGEQLSLRIWMWAVALSLLGASLYGAPALLGLSESYAVAIGGVAVVLMVAGGVILIWKGITVVGTVLTGGAVQPRHHDILVALLLGLAKVIAVAVAVLILAETFSVSYAGVLTGLGVGGVALALAAQSTIANIIAGFTIYADRPVSVGELVRFGDHLGKVEQIGLRSTALRCWDRTVVVVPNAELINLSLKNYARRERILLKTTLQLRYETSPDQLRFVLTELRRLLISHPLVGDDDMRVRLIGFGEYSLDIELYAYVLTADYSTFLAVREDVYLLIIDLVAKSGSDFAFPSQVEYQAKDSGLDQERARLAEDKVAAWRESNQLPFPNLSREAAEEAHNTLDWPPEGAVKEQTGDESNEGIGKHGLFSWRLWSR